MEHNIQGFDPDTATTSSLLIYCEKCGDQYQIGVSIEGVGDILWMNACPSCGNQHEVRV